MCNNDKMSRYCNLFQSHDSQLIWKPDQALPYVMHFENGQKRSLFRRPETKKELVIWPEIIRTKTANIEQTEDILWFSTVKESYLKGHLLAFDSSEAVFEFKHANTEKQMNSKCDEAVRQIAKREYTFPFREETVYKYGISFFKKKCLVKKA